MQTMSHSLSSTASVGALAILLFFPLRGPVFFQILTAAGLFLTKQELLPPLSKARLLLLRPIISEKDDMMKYKI